MEIPKLVNKNEKEEALENTLNQSKRTFQVSDNSQKSEKMLGLDLNFSEDNDDFTNFQEIFMQKFTIFFSKSPEIPEAIPFTCNINTSNALITSKALISAVIGSINSYLQQGQFAFTMSQQEYNYALLPATQKGRKKKLAKFLEVNDSIVGINNYILEFPEKCVLKLTSQNYKFLNCDARSLSQLSHFSHYSTKNSLTQSMTALGNSEDSIKKENCNNKFYLVLCGAN